MTSAQDRYDAAAQRHAGALQRAISRSSSVVALQADLAKAHADYDALLERTADYLDAAARALDSAGQPAVELAPTVEPASNPAAPQG